jgi:tetratricopeptide (TPR) repeat protein
VTLKGGINTARQLVIRAAKGALQTSLACATSQRLSWKVGLVSVGVLALWLGGGGAKATPSSPAAHPTLKTLSVSGSYLAARAAQQSENWPKAAGYFEEALRLAPQSSLLQRATFITRLEAGDVAKAIDLARQIDIRGNAPAIVHLVLAVEALKKSNGDLLARHLLQIKDLPFAEELSLTMTAWQQAGEKRYKSALITLNGLAKRPGFNLLATVQEAALAELGGDPTRALALYEGLVQETLAPAGGAQSPPSSSSSPAADSPSADDAQAPNSHEPTQPIDTSPETLSLPLQIVEAYGGLLQRQGQKAAATALYQRFGASLTVGDSMALLVKGALANQNRKTPPALALKDPAQGVAEFLHNLAINLSGGKGGDVANLYAQLCQYLDPTHQLVGVFLTNELLESGRYAEAVALTRQKLAQKDLPINSVWLLQLAQAQGLGDLDDIDAASKLLQAMAQEHPQRLEPLIQLGDLLRRKERYKEAAQAYDGPIARLSGQKDEWYLLYYRAIARHMAGNWPEAEADLIKAHALQPDHPSLLNYLGYRWVERGENLVKARAMIEKAVAQRPDDGAIIDSLGWAFYQLKDYPRAVIELERAIELMSTDPTVNDHLGDAYWQVGRFREARFQWERALLYAREEKLLTSLRQKLATNQP